MNTSCIIIHSMYHMLMNMLCLTNQRRKDKFVAFELISSGVSNSSIAMITYLASEVFTGRFSLD